MSSVEQRLKELRDLITDPAVSALLDSVDRHLLQQRPTPTPLTIHSSRQSDIATVISTTARRASDIRNGTSTTASASASREVGPHLVKNRLPSNTSTRDIPLNPASSSTRLGPQPVLGSIDSNVPRTHAKARAQGASTLQGDLEPKRTAEALRQDTCAEQQMRSHLTTKAHRSIMEAIAGILNLFMLEWRYCYIAESYRDAKAAGGRGTGDEELEPEHVRWHGMQGDIRAVLKAWRVLEEEFYKQESNLMVYRQGGPGIKYHLWGALKLNTPYAFYLEFVRPAYIKLAKQSKTHMLSVSTGLMDDIVTKMKTMDRYLALAHESPAIGTKERQEFIRSEGWTGTKRNGSIPTPSWMRKKIEAVERV